MPLSSVYLLPFDIQVEILKRMNDVRSLIRFRSISKAWKSLIDSPKFIDDHSIIGDHHTLQLQRQHLLLVHEEAYYQNKYVSIADNDDSFPRDRYCTTLPSALSAKPYIIRCIGSSQGLLGYTRLGVGDNLMSIILWNPSIGRYVVIGHVPNVLHPPEGDTHVGFGVCPGTSDPKLVKIVTSHHMPWQVEVYTLSSGVWRSSSCTKLPRKSIRLSPVSHPVVICGINYWLAYYPKNGKRRRVYDVIISFDLTTEEFEEICIPDTLVNQYFLVLANRIESLVVLDYYALSAVTQVYDVWLMNHGGCPKSFQKLFSIKTPDNAIYNSVLSFRKNGEPIMKTIHDYHEESTLQVYEHKSGCIRDLGICGLRSSLTVTSYRETLLLLDRPDAINHSLITMIDDSDIATVEIKVEQVSHLSHHALG